MTVKLTLLRSGEYLISEVKELVSGEPEKVHGYLLSKPRKVAMASPTFLTEETNTEKSSVQVSLSSWCILAKNDEFVIPLDWIVTFMEPADRLVTMYEEYLKND